jgi:hypothetical protein
MFKVDLLVKEISMPTRCLLMQLTMIII